jgi:hypothetical protein
MSEASDWSLSDGVNLDQSDSGAAILAADHRRVLPRGQNCHDGGFNRVLRREAERQQLIGLIRVILPVVIQTYQLPVAIEQAEAWIAKRIADSGLSERGSDGADHHLARIDVSAAQDETADHHVFRGLDGAAGAHVAQFRIIRRGEVVNFDQADAVAVRAGDGRGISRWRQRSDDGRFARIGRLETGLLDLSPLGVLPVVVYGQRRATRGEEAQDRIADGTVDSEAGQRRTDAADNHALGIAACDDEAANHDAFAGFHSNAGGNVNWLSCRARHRGWAWRNAWTR